MSEKEISSFQRKIYKCIRGFIYISMYTGVYIISNNKTKKNSTKQNNAKEEKNDHVFLLI